MIMKNIYTVYFSPTGGTKKVATALSDNLSQLLHIPSQSIDLTLPANRQISYPFDSDSLVILAVLVYAGRIPNKLLPDLEKCLNGNGKTAIIPVSVYSNRNYDEALREMLLLVEKHGFIPMGALAMISRHSFDIQEIFIFFLYIFDHFSGNTTLWIAFFLIVFPADYNMHILLPVCHRKSKNLLPAHQ